MSFGTLYLIPVPLAKDASAKSFTPYLIDTINQIKEYIVENEKTARYFLKEAGLKIHQNELIIHDYGKHHRDTNTLDFFKGLLAGNDVGLMSEAGCPGIADPGANLIRMAHKKGIKVVPLVGPSSILLALMTSGFNGQSFAFHGYLPIEKTQRIKKIKELEKTTIFPSEIKDLQNIKAKYINNSYHIIIGEKYICGKIELVILRHHPLSGFLSLSGSTWAFFLFRRISTRMFFNS
jgi:16S rRNA (cytidine1402-2'-O)-methyltransferase